MDIVSRIKNILATPQTEWPVIATEPTDPPALYMSYIIPLAAIPAVCGFIGGLFLGAPFFPMLIRSIVAYILALVGVGIVGFIFAKLAPSFGGQDDVNQGLKLAAYASTASWLGGIFLIIPALSFLQAIAGLYGLYLLYLGVPVLMKNPQDKTLVYVIVSILVMIVVSFVIFFIPARLI